MGTSPNHGMLTRPCLQVWMGNLIQPALDILIINKTCTNVQHHILDLALCAEYLATKVKIVTFMRPTINNSSLSLSLNIPPDISSNIFTPNKLPVLTQQLTTDYVLSQNAWDEITTKLNEMAKENQLIKQVVCKRYNTATGV